jgi:hypothetical protein
MSFVSCFFFPLSQEDEPSCQNYDYSDHYYEYLNLSKENLRYLIHDEIARHYPEENFDPNTPQALALAAAAGFGEKPKKDKSQKEKDALGNLGAMAGALPQKGAKKVRRKSI